MSGEALGTGTEDWMRSHLPGAGASSAGGWEAGAEGPLLVQISSGPDVHRRKEVPGRHGGFHAC
jgi:hypothetical protein